MDSTRFILIQTSHPGNVGATARAMKVMGFSDLVLVQPRFDDVLTREETVAMSSGAADILVRARIVDKLEDALDGVTHACATAMTPRDFGPPTHEPRALFAELARREPAPRLALVFGSERYGMRNEDVYKCHSVISIPTNPHYGSLNLSQIVEAVVVLTGQGHLSLAQDDAQAQKRHKNTQALNTHLMELARSSAEIGYLASPLTGGGVPVSRFHQIFLLARQQGHKTPQQWAQFAWSWLKVQGQRLVKEGQTLNTEEENIAELTRQASEFEQKDLPILKALQIA